MTKKTVKLHRFFFVRPKDSVDADIVAEELANFDSVDEVFMTEGEYGFLVKTKLCSFEEQKGLAKRISESSSEKCSMATSHYHYRK